MIYLYPANRMEDLVTLLNHVQKIQPLPVLAEEVILVQNNGMQHWLNLQMAQHRQISMNNAFSLPAAYFWRLIRELVDKEEGSDQAPYAREALSWRLYRWLADPDICADARCQQATQYWQANNNDELKRFQLAKQLADLYEQYLIFRPEWINEWQQGRQHSDLAQSSNARWQAVLWQKLTSEIPYDPVALLTKAINNLPSKLKLLPARISIFGINSLPPLWLNFIAALAEHTQVHFFHLNPCVEYWGDIVTEKQRASALKKWADNDQDSGLIAEVGNPLLANLGQQGREFVSLLQDHISDDFEAFDLPNPNHPPSEYSVLQRIQNDILLRQDAREGPPSTAIDDSIIFTSAHSPLREVQGLHDWLLHRFNHDPELTPKDVLVMCPQVESYAPYIDSVFSRGWEDFAEKVPPLPCSIADRISKDSEPMVAAFAELLTLPDSRFQVSLILSFLRLPAMLKKFELTGADIDVIADWIVKASIHWGLDGEHKQRLVQSEQVHSQFTWQYGLRKLLLGFAYADHSDIVADSLALPWVEGEHALLLGKLIHLCERLQTYSINLTKARSINQWQNDLLSMLDDLFVQHEDERGFSVISTAIDSLAECAVQANLDADIPLAVITEFLNSHFSQPDPGRQFMIGQVTFCSMLPMRSIPFKVIAVLGLNDGEFPRQRQPLSFDLIATATPKKGDRSRRGDDRYLFLEAIISARQYLYLSYQGRDIRNNNARQPSLVLTELQDYLHRGYGWEFKQEQQLRQLSMQPFNRANYCGESDNRSFDRHWLALGQQLNGRDNLHKLTPLDDLSQQVDISQLVAFFDHPSKAFAQQRLHLYLQQQDTELTDSEPFVSSKLALYKLKDTLLSLNLSTSATEPEAQQQAIERAVTIARLSGQFPDSPVADTDLDSAHADIQQLTEVLQALHISEQVEESVSVEIDDIQVTSHLLWLCADRRQLLNYRVGSFRAKDMVALWLNHLIATLSVEQQIESKGVYLAKNSKKETVVKTYQLDCLEPSEAKIILARWLSLWQEGLTQPLLLNIELAYQLYNGGKAISTDALQSLWTDINSFQPIGEDPYIQFFWPNCPPQDAVVEQCLSLYLDVFERIKECK